MIFLFDDFFEGDFLFDFPLEFIFGCFEETFSLIEFLFEDRVLFSDKLKVIYDR